jgi:7,8-dihydroneopterin aldolase/epimerase/oxygenase
VNFNKKYRGFLVVGLIMDIVFIQGLEIDTVIGIYDWEREVRQNIVLDIEMYADITAASKTDHIDQALDYKAVSK